MLVWSDDFEGTTLDPSKWSAREGPDRNGIGTPDAVEVRDGVLWSTTYTGEDGRHRAGGATTLGLFEPTYGYFEARIRFTGAPGTLCAWWLWPRTWGTPPEDGKSAVEIDIIEHRAYDRNDRDIKDRFAMTLNWKTDSIHTVQMFLPLPGGAPLAGEWHTFASRWTETDVTFYVDDVEMWSTDVAVSTRPEHLNLTCHILSDGGWAGHWPPGGYGPRGTTPPRMEVDWVRVWQLKP